MCQRGCDPAAVGHFLSAMLTPPEADGPPFTHTLQPPEPEEDEAGNLIWPEPGPSYTLTEEP